MRSGSPSVIDGHAMLNELARYVRVATRVADAPTLLESNR
jgi:hypothetical protein